MFERILSLFHPAAKASQTRLPEADARHALGALMVRVAKADNAYLFEEIEQIDHLLMELYGFNPVQAAKFRAECERLEEHLPDTPDMARIIGEATDEVDREAKVRALWRVVLADGQRHENELAVVAIATEILGLSPERAAELRETPPAG